MGHPPRSSRLIRVLPLLPCRTMSTRRSSAPKPSASEAPAPACPVCPALRIVTLPRDTNQYGTIFGGVILSYIDQAGFIEARKHGVHRWVTVALDTVVFHAPVLVGDVVNFFTTTKRLGRTSVTVEVVVQAERHNSNDQVEVTRASITLVSVDVQGTPIPFTSPPTV